MEGFIVLSPGCAVVGVPCPAVDATRIVTSLQSGVLSLVPTHISHRDAWQELPCCAWPGRWLVGGWNYSLIGTVHPCVSYSVGDPSVSSRFICALMVGS